MPKFVRLSALLTGLVLVIAFIVYTFTAPYERFPGIIIGGELTAPPDDWTTVHNTRLITMKLAGFPPFVVYLTYTADENGIITATRPDGGYWAQRLRTSSDPNGWIRIGDDTYAMNAREIVGDDRLPYLELWGEKTGRDGLEYDFEGEIIRGVNEPLYTWEVFYWTPR